MEDKATQPPANVNVGLSDPKDQQRVLMTFLSVMQQLHYGRGKTGQNANTIFLRKLVTLVGSLQH